jgi:hypothetical protein
VLLVDSSIWIAATASVVMFIEAAQIYRTGRKLGITVRSPYDCLIAACASRHEAEVLHLDRDFAQIARFTPLKQRNISDVTPSA